MKKYLKTGLVVIAATVANPAFASDKQDFVTCDGRVQPGKQDDGMRYEASTTRYGGFPNFRGDVVAACTRALANERLLPTQTLRRAHLLRARAVAHLAAGDTVKSLADLDLAASASAGLAADPFFKRSMGVSLSLLRALNHAQTGDLATAVPLATSAMAERPYSIQVQSLGAEILQFADRGTVMKLSPWEQLIRLNPEALSSAFINEAERGNFAGALLMRSSVKQTWPTAPLAPYALMGRSEDANQFFSALIVQLHSAYAHAATGDVSGARRDLEELKGKIEISRPKTTNAIPDLSNTVTFETIDNFIKVRERQISARIAIVEGRGTDAIAALIASPLPNDTATIELLTAMKAALPVKEAALVPDIKPFVESVEKQRKVQFSRLGQSALLAPETPRTVIDYARSRPNILGALVGGAFSLGTSLIGGISRTDGFKSSQNADGTTKIEFLGNTPSAALVQEMTLLRAAELARSSGNAGFVIVNRNDFSRTMRTTRNGVEISSNAAGFKTELDVRYVAAGSDSNRAFDATAVIDSLGPYYYEDKPANK